MSNPCLLSAEERAAIQAGIRRFDRAMAIYTLRAYEATVVALEQQRDAQAARLAAYQGALEAIRDLDPLAGGVRPGPTSIGDTALAIAYGLGQCQKIATAALEGQDG